MMKRIALALMAMMLVCGFTAYAEEHHEGGEGENKNVVALDKLPKEVKEAAMKAVEGITLKSAKTEKSEKGVVYVILGTAKDKNWVVKVTVDGDGKVTGTDAKAEEAAAPAPKAPEGERK
jgi:hypothetical protein